MARTVLILLVIVATQRSFASSCCGQSPASFTVLSAYQRLSLTAGLSLTQSQGRVFADSEEFYIWRDKEREVQGLLLNVAGSVSERSQLFVNASVLRSHYRDSVESGNAQHFSDTQLGYTFEVLPEYSFSYWKPIVYLSALINVPTGHSIYDESALSEGADVTGHNQWGAGLGLTLRKVYFPLTLTLQGRSLRLFSKEFDSVRVSHFYDSSLALLASYASRWWDLTFNTGVTFSHLSPRTLLSADVTSGESQNVTVLAGLQRVFAENWSLAANYSDQTLLGPAKNSILNRSLSVTLNFNYL